MLELRDIGFRYAPAATVLEGVDLTLEEGELVLVAGPHRRRASPRCSASSPASCRASPAGALDRRRPARRARASCDQPPRERAHLVGYVGQDPLAGFVTDTVEEELAYGMEQLGTRSGGRCAAGSRRRSTCWASPTCARRDLRTLSGGQQQRVAIGSVLTMHPRVLVLDEPTSALDPTAAEEVLATLTRLVHDLGVTVLLAEHRLERVVPFADRIVPRRPATAASGSASPREMLVDSPVAPPLVELGRLAGWEPLPLTVRDARRRARARCPSWPPPEPQSPPATDAAAGRERGVTVVHGRTVAVREARPRPVAPGRVTALMGRNGSGKSILMWALQGSGRDGRATVARRRQRPGRRWRPPSGVRWSGWCRRPPRDLLYLETVAEECAAADAGAGAEPGTCRGLLDRLAPGIDGDQPPARPLRGPAAGAGAGASSSPPGRRSCCSTSRPAASTTPARRRWRGSSPTSPPTATPSCVATHDVEFVAQVADHVVVLAEGEVVSAGPGAAGASPSRRRSPRRSPRCSARRGCASTRSRGAGAGRCRTRMSILSAPVHDPARSRRRSGRGRPWCWPSPRWPG